MVKVLFVCTGNICRSPLAHGIFESYIQANGLSHKLMVDSAGTSGYHVGSLPDLRSRDIAKLHGVVLTHRARVFTVDDFTKFDYILVMDYLNYEDVISKSKNAADRAKVLLLRSFDELSDSDFNIPDPYYGFSKDFEDVYALCERSISGFSRFIRSKELV